MPACVRVCVCACARARAQWAGVNRALGGWWVFYKTPMNKSLHSVTFGAVLYFMPLSKYYLSAVAARRNV